MLRGLVALAAAVLYFSGAAAEARVLLTLDDFGAVGDGIANDTEVLYQIQCVSVRLDWAID
jgi:hypothetical protein